MVRLVKNRKKETIFVKLTWLTVWDEIVGAYYLVLVDYNDPQGRYLKRLFQQEIGVHCWDDYIQYHTGEVFYAIFPLWPFIINPDILHSLRNNDQSNNDQRYTLSIWNIPVNMSQWDLLYREGYRVYTGFGLDEKIVIPSSGWIIVEYTAYMAQRDATRVYHNRRFFYGNPLWN
jgi:hypothetical protein